MGRRVGQSLVWSRVGGWGSHQGVSPRPQAMSEVVGDIQAMTATALHILPDTSSRGGDHTSNSCARGGVRCESNRGSQHRRQDQELMLCL